MILPHHHAVLAMEVVRLTLSPVKPANCLIAVRPPPLARAVLTVALLNIKLSNSVLNLLRPDNLRLCPQPELTILSDIC